MKQINNKIIFCRVKVYGKLSKISKIRKAFSWGNGDIVNFTDQTKIRENAITVLDTEISYNTNTQQYKTNASNVLEVTCFLCKLQTRFVLQILVFKIIPNQVK